MQAEALLVRLCGFEGEGRQVRVYFDEPAPLPSLGRQHGVRSGIFRDLTGAEADGFRHYLVRHPEWGYLQVYPAAVRGPRGPVSPSCEGLRGVVNGRTASSTEAPEPVRADGNRSPRTRSRP